MKFGFSVPTRGPVANPESIAALARKGEELGVSHLMLGLQAATLEGTMDRMERFATDVKPLAA
jgi:hypothetical protein